MDTDYNKLKLYNLLEISELQDVEKFIYQVDAGLSQRKYFQFKVTFLEGDNLRIVQIVDISSTILYGESKAQNEFLQLINATVSHELRNPLNSLKAQNILKKNLYKKLKSILDKYSIDTCECDRILIELNEGLEI